MNVKEVLKELESLGTEQNRKIYRRHGAGDNMYGVSFANLYKLKKKYKGQHELGVELWATGNSDAMTLGTFIIDPKKVTEKDADKWVKESYICVLSDYLAAIVIETDFYKKKIEEWTKSPKEFIKRAGYTLLSLAIKNGKDLGDEFYAKYLPRIKKEIHKSPNRAKEGMNSALLSIGWYLPKLKNDALKTANQIGTVEIDHGETSCTTVDAAASIKKGKIVRI